MVDIIQKKYLSSIIDYNIGTSSSCSTAPNYLAMPMGLPNASSLHAADGSYMNYE